MSGTSITVAVGRTPTQISGAPLATGTTIFNSDPVNSIWLADNNGVVPGNGIELGPLATGQWSKNSLCFACVDTGVSTPISIQISGDLGNVTDPVAIASATAAQLLVSGVPNVVVTKMLQRLAPILSGGLLVQDVTGFASAYIEVSNSANPTFTDIVVRFYYTLADAQAGNGRQIAEYHLANNVGSGLENTLSFVVQCASSFMTLTNDVGFGGSIQVTIVGSNQPALALIDSETNPTGPDRWYISANIPVPITVGAPIFLTPYTPNDSGQPRKLQGMCSFHCRLTASTAANLPTGVFYLRWTEQNGAVLFVAFATTVNGLTIGNNQYIFGQVALPAVPYDVVFIAATAGGSGAISLIESVFIKGNI